MTATSPLTVSNSPKVIASGAVAIAIPAATNAIPGHATAAHITAIEANTAKVTNATHTGHVTGSGALTIAGGVVTNVMCAAALKDPAAGTAGLRTIGTGALTACAGNDARLSDTRTPPNSGVTQAKLKTSQSSVSITVNPAESSGSHLTLPGGEYGFYPRFYMSRSVPGGANYGSVSAQMLATESEANLTSHITRIRLTVVGGGDGTRTYTGYAQQRYVTASGEVHWIFILRDKITKQVVSTYQAPDHPCFGNGSKPLLVPHPFGDYDESRHEIIVINPSFDEIEQMELETIVDDETKPDKDLLEVITENYEIDEGSNPAWPNKEVTVGLPKHIIDKTGKKKLADYRFMGKDDVVIPIKKSIPKPSYIKVKSLKRK